MGIIMRELGRGKYSDCFKVFEDGVALALKVSYYQEATIRAYARHLMLGDCGAAMHAKDKDAVSVSMAMAEVAKQMRQLGVSPHIVRVYCEADIRHLPLRLKALLSTRLQTLTPRQVKYSHVCLMDLFACNLTRLVRSRRVGDRTLRCLLFQVLYTLTCLQKLFPGFRHNDLSTNNVLVKWVRGRQIPTHKYVLEGTAFFVCSAYSVAIADFDFTHVPGHAVLSNERVMSGKYGISGTHDPGYDAHLLLRSLSRLLLKSKHHPETSAFVAGLALDSPDRPVQPKPHLSPACLLAHSYFAPLRVAHGRHDRCYVMPACSRPGAA